MLFKLMEQETQSIIIPLSYSIESATEIVLQMRKDITHIINIGDYYYFQQFRMPKYCRKEIINIGNGIRVVKIKRYFPQGNARALPQIIENLREERAKYYSGRG